ncbi:membrane hypothetical protein [uncultured Defluviicoccus sp.]|uniref:O-antigen polysaccharide polymerase Wzy n=1 Tax=metagenome TaxID=256318 RepID=A0A380TMC6_9ZZZZ|nr:membrane hypothetical protein [uncultured Defluviicoccus sp.]
MQDASRLGCAGFEILGLLTLCGLYILTWGSGEPALATLVNLLGAFCYGALLTAGAWRTLRVSTNAIWTPLFWFRFTAATFYGLGAMVTFIAPDQTVASILGWYAYTQEELLKVNLLNAAATLVLLLAVRVMGGLLALWLERRPDKHGAAGWAALPAVDLPQCASVFLGVGLFVRYFLELPHQFAMLDFVLPGIVMQLRNFAYVGLFIAFVLAFRGFRSWAMVASGILAAEALVSLLTFGKQDTLVTLLMPVLAAFTVSHSRRALALGLVGLLAVYVAIKPVSDFGRVEIQRMRGNITQATLSERFEILARFSYADAEADAQAHVPMAWLARLNYAGPQAFALSLRERGIEATSFERAYYALIPRLLWPDKPLVTALGSEITYLARGFNTSSTGISIFAEAYWNHGVLGVVLWTIHAGIVYLVYAAYAFRVMRSRSYWFLPVVLLGILSGYTHSADFVPTFIGGAAQAIVIHFALKLAASWLARLTLRPTDERLA